jgi:hypothetical protein
MEYHIISSKGDKVPLCIDDEMTVGDVRGVAAAMLDAPEDRIMTVSLAGKLLTDDTETWGDLRTRLFHGQQPAPMQRKLFCNLTNKPVTEVQSGEVMRMFASKEERKQEQEKERQSAEAMESMVESLAQNPGMLESMLSMNPQIQKLQKKSPEVARMLKDPDTLKTILLSSVNPERRKEMERNAELQLAQISAMPGGQQAINHYMDQMDEDGEEEETENERAIRIGTTAPTATNDSLYTPDPTKDANNEPMPNPWAASSSAGTPIATTTPATTSAGGAGPLASNLFSFFAPSTSGAAAGGAVGASPASLWSGQDPASVQAMWQMMMQSVGSNANHAYSAAGAATATTSASPATQAEPADASTQVDATPSSSTVLSEEMLQAGLAALRDMGFEDEVLCRRALQAAGGDVEAAVDYIAEHLDE